jgi:hypothetical protein
MTKKKKKDTKQPKKDSKPSLRELNAINTKSSGRKRNVSLFSSQIPPKLGKQLDEAIRNRDSKKMIELSSLVEYDEGYINCPDLKFPKGNSIKKLQATLYSSQTKDEKILHHLLQKSI